MTSKNLFFKRMKQDLEQRIWLPVVTFILGFLMTELPLISSLENWRARTNYVERALDFLMNNFFSPNVAFSALTIGVAAISALSGFAYMHSAKKLDVYHSIPVKRETLFLQQYVYGILYYVVPVILHVLICLGICAGNGLLTISVLGQAVWFVLVQLLIYLAFYSVVITVVCLTGNMVISVLGSGVLMCYSLVLALLKSSLMDTFFMTYYSVDTYMDFPAFSPLHSLMNMVNYMVMSDADYIQYTDYLWEYGKLILMAAVYTIIALLLYKKRPTEVAGKTMAFPITESAVKVMVVLPVSIASGYLFEAIFSYSDSFVWFVIGCIFGFAIGCPLMEIIFRKDVKAVFSHPLQLAFNGACIAVVLVVLKFDVLGYDSYLPKESEVESYAISFSEHDQIYGTVDASGYRLDNMTITDNESTRKLLEHAVEITRPARTDDWNRVNVALEAGEVYYSSFSVKYTLKNGQEVYRNLLMNLKEEEVVQWLCDTGNDMQYKLGVYPILSEKVEKNYNGIQVESAFSEDLIPLSEEKMQKLVETYQRELTNLTFEEIMEEYPVAKLDFTRPYSEDSENTMPMPVVEEYVITEYADDSFRYNSMEYGYKIYPSFVQTIALLEEYGVPVVSEIPAEDVIRITVEDHTGDVYREVEYSSREGQQEEIAQILPNLKSNQLNIDFEIDLREEANRYVSVTYLYDGIERGSNFRFLKGSVPEFVNVDLNKAAR